jgi:putative CocE/NonD family hydrolase
MTKPYVVSNAFMGDKLDSVLMTLPLIEQDRAMGWRISFLRDWLSHPENDRYWERTSVSGNYDQIRASVYNIGGWYDILLKGTIDNYLKMTGQDIDREIRNKQKLLIGPWDHGVRGPQLGDLDFGEESVLNRRELMLRWFDNQLKGLDNGIMQEPPVKIFVMGINRWRYENEWPLARTEYRNYYFSSKGDANTLNGDGNLKTKPSKKEMTDQYVYDPEDPVPTIGAMGPYDMSTLEERPDVLVYTSPPLKKDLEVTGPVRAIIYASSSAVSTDFTAKLVDVYPDGRAIRICEGIIRASHRDPDATPSNIVPGKIYQFQIDLWATSNVFMKGHRMRVEISSSNFPRFDRNLNTGLNFATDTTMIKAEQTIYHSTDFPSRIILPVINNH